MAGVSFVDESEVAELFRRAVRAVWQGHVRNQGPVIAFCGIGMRLIGANPVFDLWASSMMKVNHT